MEYLILNNGLKLLLYPMPNTHSITVGLYLKAGSCNEKETQRGITHFLEHLHFRRMNILSQNDLYYQMESIGSTLRAATYRDFTKFTMKIAPEHLEKCLEIFKNLVEATKWTKEDLKLERKVVLDQIEMKNEYLSLERESDQLVFAGSKLANDIMGTAESVQALTVKELSKYKKKICTKNRILFCVTGNVSPKEQIFLQKELEQISVSDGKEIKAGENFAPTRFYQRMPDIYYKNVSGHRLDVSLSFDVNYKPEEMPMFQILNCILGEGVGSRLQKKLREDLGYTTDIASTLELYQGMGVLHIRFSIPRKLLEKCLAEIVRILNDMKRNLTKRDLDVSLPFYTSNLKFYEDDTEQMNFLLAYESFILGISHKTQLPDGELPMINQLQKISEKLFITENVSMVILGDTKKDPVEAAGKILQELDKA